jgi:non-ribosomal peptide synthetase component E (peptide arylation enzyme)
MKKLKMSYCHRCGPEMEKGFTFGEMLENSAAFFPDNIAICFGEREYTYR